MDKSNIEIYYQTFQLITLKDQTIEPSISEISDEVDLVIRQCYDNIAMFIGASYIKNI